MFISIKRFHFEDLKVERETILKWNFKKEDGVLNWINTAPGRSNRQDLENMIIKIGVQKARSFA